MGLEALVWLVIKLVLILVVIGILLWIVEAAPIPDPPKRYVRFAVIALGGLILVLYLIRVIEGVSLASLALPALA